MKLSPRGAEVLDLGFVFFVIFLRLEASSRYYEACEAQKNCQVRFRVNLPLASNLSFKGPLLSYPKDKITSVEARYCQLDCWHVPRLHLTEVSQKLFLKFHNYFSLAQHHQLLQGSSYILICLVTRYVVQVCTCAQHYSASVQFLIYTNNGDIVQTLYSCHSKEKALLHYSAPTPPFVFCCDFGGATF